MFCSFETFAVSQRHPQQQTHFWPSRVLFKTGRKHNLIGFLSQRLMYSLYVLVLEYNLSKSEVLGLKNLQYSGTLALITLLTEL